MKIRFLKIKWFAALAVLMASLLAVGGATWAWFASNTVVTATDMNVRIKSDGTYMLIAARDPALHPLPLTADEVQDVKACSADAIDANAALYPAGHNDIAYIVDADTASNWYFMHSLDPNRSGGAGYESDYETLTAGNYHDYVLSNEFSITVADGANAMADLKVYDCSITTAGSQAVKVLVATEYGAEEFSPDHRIGSVVLAPSVDSDTAIRVKVYVYWDGADADVYTKNIAQLKETNVEVVFSGDIVESP